LIEERSWKGHEEQEEGGREGGETNGVLFLDVELEVDGAGAGGGYAEL
jgi:hypothetical protein